MRPEWFVRSWQSPQSGNWRSRRRRLFIACASIPGQSDPVRRKKPQNNIPERLMMTKSGSRIAMDGGKENSKKALSWGQSIY